MWKMVGMAMLMSRVAMASTSEETAYYASDRDEDGGSEIMESTRRVGTGELVAPEAIGPVNEEENEAASREQRRRQPQPDNAPLLDYSRPKSETKRPKRPIVRMNLIDDRLTKHRETSAPLATLLYWPDHDQTNGDVNERNPRTPGRASTPFSPWGGKRDLARYKTIAKIRRPVRVPFNSWGGKRNGESLDSLKRDALRTWEGKKTPPFNSWGGKRASIVARPGCDFIRRPTESGHSEYDDFASFRHLENVRRVQQPRKFVDDENATSDGHPLGDYSPRAAARAAYPRGRYSDDERRGADFAPSFQKFGPPVPWTE